MRTLVYRDRSLPERLPDGALLARLGVLAIMVSLACMLVLARWTGGVPGWPPCDDQPGVCPGVSDAASASP